jgi:tyrosyl-tRNA synthetase
MTVDIKKELEIYRRGTVEIISEDELEKKLVRSRKEKRPLIVKLGVDASASDIHLGNAVPIRKLKQFQDNGHRVVFLIGDFTGMIGDPSGRSKTRESLDKEKVLANARTFKSQVFKILDKRKTKVVFNSQWCKQLNFEDVIKLTSKYTVARILERDDFQNRYKSGNPIGIHEFIYPLIQGYDSVKLKADIEICGTDQRFNCLVARNLQIEFRQEPEVIVMLPLLEGIDGKQKMSKSYGNYIGITEDPQQIYGKIMSLPDNLMIKYFELCTDMPLKEIKEIERGLAREKLHPKEVKKRLAFELVRMYHSTSAAKIAEREFEKVFKHKQTPACLPQVKLKPYFFKDKKIWIIDLLVKANLATSSSEARRLVSQKAVSIDNQKIGDVEARISIEKVPFIIKVGKRKFAKIII